MPIDPNIIGQLRQPEPVNPLSNIMQIMQLKQAQQLLPLRLQEAQLSLQESQMKAQAMQRDEQEHLGIKQAITDAGGDIETAAPKILQAAPTKGIAFLTAARQQRQEELKAHGEKLKNAMVETSLIGQMLQGVKASPHPDLAYQWAMDALKAKGVDTGRMKQAYDSEAVDQYMATGLTQEQALTEQHKQLEGEIKKAAEARTAATAPFDLRKREAEAILAEKTAAGEKPIQPVDRERQAFEQKKFDQTLADFADKVRHEKATEAETAKYHNMSIEAVDLTPEAKMKMAEMFASTGALPALGNGKAAAKARTDIINEAAAKFPQVDFASAKGAYQANITSLKNMQKQSDSVNAFEATAGKNIDVFLEKAGKIVDTGSPLLNSPARMLSDRVFGSENMAAFKAARETALTEAAKVLESPQGNAALTVSGREAVKTLSDTDATLGQQVAAMKVLRQDMANRKQSNAETIKAIQDRIGQANPNAQPVMNPPARLDATPKEVTKAEYDALPVGSDYLKDGKHYTKK